MVFICYLVVVTAYVLIRINMIIDRLFNFVLNYRRKFDEQGSNQFNFSVET